MYCLTKHPTISVPYILAYDAFVLRFFFLCVLRIYIYFFLLDGRTNYYFLSCLELNLLAEEMMSGISLSKRTACTCWFYLSNLAAIIGYSNWQDHALTAIGMVSSGSVIDPSYRQILLSHIYDDMRGGALGRMIYWRSLRYWPQNA